MFTDIKQMATVESKKKAVVTTKPPYCGYYGHLQERECWEIQSRDMYSVGVVILEIIVGTELVIMSKKPFYLNKLLSDLGDYLDP
jgi:hypothetical protein